MHVKRFKGDKQNWLAKVFSPAIGDSIRLEYERLHPVPMGSAGSDPATIPNWQLPSGSPLTKARLQTFLQMHMEAQGAPEELCKSHSLRKGGVMSWAPSPGLTLWLRGLRGG
jgi:hypothetical protein